MTVGEKFVQRSMWVNTPSMFFMLLGRSPRSVDEGFLKKLKPMPAPDGGTHWVLHVRERFVHALQEIDSHDRLAYLLNQLLPWDVIAQIAPDTYQAWNDKLAKKAEATALNERNRLAKLESKEIAEATANRSASSFMRERRELQRETQAQKQNGGKQ